MIKEFDKIVLTTDLLPFNLKKGDVGTVIAISQNGRMGYEVEFMTLYGDTVAIVSLETEQVRPIGQREIAHARMIDV
jgi:hypothetical protein